MENIDLKGEPVSQNNAFIISLLQHQTIIVVFKFHQYLRIYLIFETERVMKSEVFCFVTISDSGFYLTRILQKKIIRQILADNYFRALQERQPAVELEVIIQIEHDDIASQL